jgi:hypothetical protein
MKTAILTLLTLSLAIPAAFAEDATVPKGEGKDRPCMKIEQACSAAGFVKGGAKEGKDLFVNCVKPILDGKSVPSVAVDADTIKACQDIKTKRDQRRDNVDPSKSK